MGLLGPHGRLLLEEVLEAVVYLVQLQRVLVEAALHLMELVEFTEQVVYQALLVYLSRLRFLLQ